VNGKLVSRTRRVAPSAVGSFARSQTGFPYREIRSIVLRSRIFHHNTHIMQPTAVRQNVCSCYVTPCKEMKDSHFKSVSDLNHLAISQIPTSSGDVGDPVMHIGKLVFSQVVDSLPMHAFRRGIARYDGNRYEKTFSCLDQYLHMTFAQLTHRESLRDIEVCLRAQKDQVVPQGYPGQRFQGTLQNCLFGGYRRVNSCSSKDKRSLRGKPWASAASLIVRKGIVHIDLLMRPQHVGIPATFHKARRKTGFFKVPPRSIVADAKPCSIFKATSQLLSTSPTASYTTSMSLIC